MLRRASLALPRAAVRKAIVASPTWVRRRFSYSLSALTPFILKTQAAFFRVTTTADAPQASPGPSCASTRDGQCTLRAAIQAANALGGGEHTISLAVKGTYALVAGAGEDSGATGD